MKLRGSKLTIFLKDIWHIENTDDYKIHFGRNNKSIEPIYGEEPLDAWVRHDSNWQKWQEYYPGRNDFNQKYIFSLMKFHRERDTWLFGGVFEVLKRRFEGDNKSYEVNLTKIRKNFIGRLKIKSSYRSRPTRLLMKPHYGLFKVKEILPKRYTG